MDRAQYPQARANCICRGDYRLRHFGVRITRILALLLAVLLAVSGVAGCSADTGDRHPELVVGSTPDSEAMLLAAIYVAALRSYGFAAHAETAADPVAKLDSGAFTVVPAFTGQMLQTLQPDASVRSDAQVYRPSSRPFPRA
ncbi:lipoprotein LPQZ [Mycobacterium tuberculosis]|nr:lipoprotein LPQZ [Mycobacterium tuberculosis]